MYTSLTVTFVYYGLRIARSCYIILTFNLWEWPIATLFIMCFKILVMSIRITQLYVNFHKCQDTKLYEGKAFVKMYKGVMLPYTGP